MLDTNMDSRKAFTSTPPHTLWRAMSAYPRGIGKEEILVLPVMGLVGSKGLPPTAPSGLDHAWMTGTRFGTAVGKLGISVCKCLFLLCICRQGCCE